MIATASTAALHADRPVMPLAALAEPAGRAPLSQADDQAFGQQIAEVLRLVSAHVPLQRRVVHAGDRVYQAGQACGMLYLVNSGCYKVLTLSPDGREQLVALKFRGDWLGLDGIAHGHYGSDVVALDTGEVWAVRYEALIEAGLAQRGLLTALHQAMSREIAGERGALMSVCTLSGDARVADFLHGWAASLGQRGLRTDQITLRLTRAEIGNHLGLTLESVSRALSRLAQSGLIGFAGKGRRELCIPDLAALSAFVQRSLAPQPTLQ